MIYLVTLKLFEITTET